MRDAENGHDLRDVIGGIDAQAGDWVLRMSERDVASETISAWLEWYHADTRHRDAFERLQSDYVRLKSIPETRRHEIGAALLADLPSIDAQAVSSPRRRTHVRRYLSWAVAATLVASVAVGIWQGRWVVQDPRSGTFSTERGVNREVALPDGSKVVLGADSALSFHFTDDARYVVLESGEAYFKVAHDRQHPFLVHVGGMTVRAVGTAFNIRRAVERVVVTVSEGIVDVQRGMPSHADKGSPASEAPTARPLRLKAGEEAIVSARQQIVVAVKAADPVAADAWKTGRLEFVDEPLSDVLATLNRYSRHNIVITDHDLDRIILTGTVMESHIDEWLRSLPDIFPVHVTQVGDTVLLSPARETPPAG